MNSQIATYVQSLTIDATQADLVREFLENEYSGAVVSKELPAVKPSIIVAVLKLLLGEAKVSSKPGDDVLANQNWSVSFPIPFISR